MRQTFAALVLAVSLVPMPHRPGLFDPLWSFVSSLWGGSSKEGCGWDPSGRCLPAQQSQPATTKEGCSWDPNGRCLQTPQSQPLETDAGCSWDPSGRTCS